MIKNINFLFKFCHYIYIYTVSIIWDIYKNIFRRGWRVNDTFLKNTITIIILLNFKAVNLKKLEGLKL